ncbi:hypothetical protein ACQCU1_03335 [Sutcliffiella horikoshii]|uniref:hypothetical protein n=1 Tax=Sutcliffiella horikoshii TaxID=79883 RepID=UPI003CF666E7
MGISSDEFLSAFFEGFKPVIQTFFFPLIMWTVIPAIIFTIIFGKKHGWPIGGCLGFIALITIGPFSH